MTTLRGVHLPTDLPTDLEPVAADVVDVTVVVVTYDSAGLLPDLLDSLPSALGGTTWRLVVADNDSHDDTVAVLRSLAPDALVVETGRNAGYAAGINAAVAAAGPHRHVLVLNPDVRLAPGCVRTLLAALAEPGVGIAVPRLSDASGRLITSMRREPTVARALADTVLSAQLAGRVPGWGEMVTDPAAYDESRTVAWAEGSVQLVSEDCWRDCGAWDESFFLYSEETEYHLRAGARGHAVRYVAAARAQHLEGGSATSPRLWPLLVRNRVRLHRRRHGVVRGAAYWSVVVLREASRALLGRATSRAALRDLLDPRRMRGAAGPDWLR